MFSYNCIVVFFFHFFCVVQTHFCIMDREESVSLCCFLFLPLFHFLCVCVHAIFADAPGIVLLLTGFLQQPAVCSSSSFLSFIVIIKCTLLACGGGWLRVLTIPAIRPHFIHSLYSSFFFSEGGPLVLSLRDDHTAADLKLFTNSRNNNIVN